MFKIRQSISLKLFIAMSAVSVLVIVFVAASVAFNMRSGFALYLAQAELGKFTRLHDALVASHDANNPGWPNLQNDRKVWSAFVRKALPRGPPGQPPKPDRNRRPPRPDPLSLGIRLALLNADGTRIAGGQTGIDIFARRPILSSANPNSDRPLGWIALTAAPDGAAAGNALFLKDQLMVLLLTSLLALLLSGVAAFYLSRQFLKPVNKIANAGEELSRGNYAIRLVNNRNDELGTLVEQFNALAINLDTKDKAERKWVSDTSHELKTPLAVLRAQIEAIQDGVHKANKKRFGDLHDSTMRLSKLVEDLNTLSNAHEGGLRIERRREDLGGIVVTSLENIEQDQLNEGLSIQTDLQPGLHLHCDPLRIRQLIDNLLQNARRYTDAPGQIRISGRKVKEAVEIEVEDTPPCPSDEDIKKLFDRFFREEQSRNRRYGGSGLGLSICREIVNAHGGAIRLSRSELGGLRVTISLPLGESSDE